ncbi:MAG: hypothetical protein WKF65_10640 [Gaiellaceae bacterium]
MKRASIMTVLVAAAVAVAIATGIAQATRHSPGDVARLQTALPLPVNTLEAFERAPSAAERAAGNSSEVLEAVRLLTAADVGVPAAWLPGAARANDLRVPLAKVGSADRSVFMFRTSRGRLCYGLSGFSSGCLQGLPASVPVTAMAGEPDAYDAGEGPVVFGFARNDVQAVDVIVAGKPYPAEVGANAYFFQLPDNRVKAAAFEAVVAHLSGGRSERIDVLSPPTDAGIVHGNG